MLPVENDIYTPIVGRYMRIFDTTWGDEKKGYLVRYRGELTSQDSSQAYDQLAQDVHSLGINTSISYRGKPACDRFDQWHYSTQAHKNLGKYPVFHPDRD